MRSMKEMTESVELWAHGIINAPAKPNFYALIGAIYIALTIWINIFPEWSANWMLHGLVW